MTGPLTVRVIPDDVVRRANLDYLDPADVGITAFGDEWIAAGIMGRLEGAARDGYDRMIGLELSDVSVDGSGYGTAGPCSGACDARVSSVFSASGEVEGDRRLGLNVV